MLLFNNF